MVQNNFNVGKIMNDSVFWDEDSINGDCVIGGWEGWQITGLLQTVPPRKNHVDA